MKRFALGDSVIFSADHYPAASGDQGEVICVETTVLPKRQQMIVRVKNGPVYGVDPNEIELAEVAV